MSDYGYAQPLAYTISPALTITKVKHGVTELTLSDGQIMRLTLHIDKVEKGANNQVDVSYQIVTEMMNTAPELPILDIHETPQ